MSSQLSQDQLAEANRLADEFKKIILAGVKEPFDYDYPLSVIYASLYVAGSTLACIRDDKTRLLSIEDSIVYLRSVANPE